MPSYFPTSQHFVSCLYTGFGRANRKGPDILHALAQQGALTHAKVAHVAGKKKKKTRGTLWRCISAHATQSSSPKLRQSSPVAPISFGSRPLSKVLRGPVGTLGGGGGT